MNFDHINLATIPAPKRPELINDERIPVNDDTRGDAAHVDAIRAYTAQLRRNREATPVREFVATRGSEL